MKHVNNQIGLIALIKRSRPINLITGPIIYMMILPIFLLDLFVSFYQWTCFPVYGIPKISRKDHIIFDRQELSYLDWISKFHCTYCAYGVGVVAYVGQVIDATEKYFCPIKHRLKNSLSQDSKSEYLEFDEPEDFDFEAYLETSRQEQAHKLPKVC
jgi:hypothetical protein